MSDLVTAVLLRLVVLVPIWFAVQPVGALRSALLIFGLLMICSAIEGDHWKQHRRG